MESPVVKFFDGAHVLITGGTGFLGRVLMEKLLRSCPGVERIYLIIRVKKDMAPSKRLAQLFEDPVFGPLKKVLPDFHKKVTLIPGDCGEIGLGLSGEDRLLLTSNVTHVFHGAATVRLDAPLKRALQVNVRGVREILLLSKDCRNLTSMIHISTAYAYSPLSEIDEKFYKAPMTGEKAMKLLDCLDDVTLEAITPQLIIPWPNTYSFSKCIAEDFVETMGKNLPVAVVRPAIVIGCNREPIPGWIDNVYGCTGVVAAAGAGLMRVLCANPEMRADLVPVDMAVNSIICTAWEVALRKKSIVSLQKFAGDSVQRNEGDKSTNQNKNDVIPVYNFVAARENPVTWDDFKEIAINERFRVPSIYAIWFLTFSLTKHWWVYQILAFLYHTVPACILDTFLVLAGKKPRLVEAYKKIHRFSGVIAYFATKEWVFGETNTRQLWSKLTPEDQQLFHFNMRDIYWPKFFIQNYKSVRIYIMKDDPSTTPAAIRRMMVFCVLHYSLLAVIYISLALLLYPVAFKLLSFLLWPVLTFLGFL